MVLENNYVPNGQWMLKKVYNCFIPFLTMMILWYHISQNCPDN